MTETPETSAPTPPTVAQKLAAEGIGTFLLVLIGCGTLFAVNRGEAIGGDFLTPALAFGLVLVGLGVTFGRISGGHFNPVLSLGSALAGRLAWVEALMMAGVQIVGGIVGGVVLVVLLKGFKVFDAFSSPIGPSVWGDKFTGYAWWAAILSELILSVILVIVYLGTTDSRNGVGAWAPVVVGLTFAALYMASIGATGGGVNPARSIGADLFSGGDAAKGVWVFIIGPVLGAAAGGLLYPLLFGRDADAVPGSGLNFAGSSSSSNESGYPGQWGQPGGYQGYQAPGEYQGGYQAGGYQGGYQPGGQQAPAAQSAQSAPQAEQPIIQDGWQWDPQAQQWIPAQQQPPAGGESTQIRGPEGS